MTRITQIPNDDRVSGASGAWFLAARLSLAAVFLYSGAAKLLFWSGGIEEFAALGLPMPALALAAFTVAATLVGHPFWAFDGADFHRQLTIALEHLAVVGGLLAIAAAGPGLFSLQPREHSS